jgi:hypothetical protein
MISTAAVAQSSDSQTLPAILEELRQLRQDLLGTTVLAQRPQIHLYRLQLQDDAAKKATQRHEQTVAKLNDAQRARADATNGLKRAEDKLSSLGNQNQRTAVEAEVSEMKRRVEMSSQDELLLQAAEIAAANDLKNEKVTLADLQQHLYQLEHQLESIPPRRNLP